MNFSDSYMLLTPTRADGFEKTSMAHDRHGSGADQMHGLNPGKPEEFNLTCLRFDLQTALTAMQVPATVIALLLHDVQSKGMFMLVDATGRIEEVRLDP